MEWVPPWKRKRLRLRMPVLVSFGGLIVGSFVLWTRWLYVHPSNPAIAAALSLMADFVPMAIAVVGIVMSYRAPKKEHHLRTTLILIMCGFVGTGILFLARIRGEDAHKDEMNALNGKLQSVADQNQKILANLAAAPSTPKREGVSTPKPTEAERRKNVLALLRNEYVLSHNTVSPSILAGTEQPPVDWVNGRLKQLGEKWTVEKDPLKIKGWEILPYKAGERITARLHLVPSRQPQNVFISFYRGIQKTVDDYNARKLLEEVLWQRVENQIKDNYVSLSIPSEGDPDPSASVESMEILTQDDVDSLKGGSVFYFMAIVLMEDRQSRLESCIHTEKESITLVGFCVGHND